jgi:hypothetical protein
VAPAAMAANDAKLKKVRRNIAASRFGKPILPHNGPSIDASLRGRQTRQSSRNKLHAQVFTEAVLGQPDNDPPARSSAKLLSC